MNIPGINPTPAGVAGNSAAPFNYGVCPCHAAVQRSRDLVATQRASTIATIDRTAAAIVCSKDIEWAGPASEEFRSRLDEFRSKAALLADDMEATHRLVWGRHDERKPLLAGGSQHLRWSRLRASHTQGIRGYRQITGERSRRTRSVCCFVGCGSLAITSTPFQRADVPRTITRELFDSLRSHLAAICVCGSTVH